MIGWLFIARLAKPSAREECKHSSVGSFAILVLGQPIQFANEPAAPTSIFYVPIHSDKIREFIFVWLAVI